MILTIYNGKSDIVVFWHQLNSTAEKTRDDQQLINKWEIRNVETMTDKQLSLKP